MLLPKPAKILEKPSVNIRMTKNPKKYPARATNQVAATRSLPDEAQVASAEQIIHHHQQTFQHSGPLPDPASLDRYNQIVPDAAERIIRMAEQNADHVRSVEMLAINAEIEDNKQRHNEVKIGQFAGLISVGMSFSLAGYALFLGHAAVAGTICSATVIGLVTVFVTGRYVKPDTTQDDKTKLSK